MIPCSVTPYVDSGLGAQSGALGPNRWPVALGAISWGRGRMLPSVRCVLVTPDHGPLRLGAAAGACAAFSSRRSGRPAAAAAAAATWPWPASSSSPTGGFVARTRQLASALADTHKAWSSTSLQTLQRVGNIIRSTSLECIAALGTTSASTAASAKAGGSPAAAAAAANGSAAHQQQQQVPVPPAASSSSAGPPPPPQGPGEEDQDEAEVRAGLRRFLAAADSAEVRQAVMLADLSDMAYDVGCVTPDRLLREHGLTLVAHSHHTSAAAQEQPLQLQAPGANIAGRQQQQQRGASPLPAPVALMMHSPSSCSFGGKPVSTGMPHGGGSSSAPTSPRTPLVMSSYTEADDPLEGAAAQLVLASGSLADALPRRLPSAAAAASAAVLSGAPVSPSSSGSLPAAIAAGDAPPAAAAAGLPYLLMQDEGAWLEGGSQQQVNLHGEVLLQQLKQQEALLLLEMEANRQLLSMLQQQQQDAPSPAAAFSSGSLPAAPFPLPLMEVMADAVGVLASSSSADQLGGSSSLAAAAASPAAAAQQQDAAAAGAAPADWFCADGPLSATDATPTRLFVIQGSISLEHWRINLTIDPVEFEAGQLGRVKVHRGVYEAALSMYDTLAPLVAQHLAEHPGGKVAFTGHSLGGSLATLLMLLYVHRGLLPPGAVATVRTFGSPAVFCEGATGSAPSGGACESCSLPCAHRRAAAASKGSAGSSTGLLARLGLPADAVVNVVMTRDIVPRAFVCDYTLVAGVLRSWVPSFKEHTGLAACKQHKALYNFVGTVEVLQPTPDCDFVLPGEGHTMLPPNAALYRLTEPTAAALAAASGPPRQQQQQQPASSGLEASKAPRSSSSPVSGLASSLRKSSFGSLASLTSLSSRSLSAAFSELASSFALASATGSDGGNGGSSAGGNGASSRGMVAVAVSAAEALAEASAAAASSTTTSSSAGGDLTLGDAILTFMNSPHPLQTLGEMRAYGPNGSISRYHNPASYTKALRSLERQQQQPLR